MSSPIRRTSRAREEFAGPQLHCRHWRDQHELDRLHVAVVGGGTALARVLPPVVAQARRVTVFQHDPVWILPTPPVPGVGLLLRQLPHNLLGSLPSHSAPPLPGDPDGGAHTGDSLTPHSQLGAAILDWLRAQALRRAAAANLRLQVADSWQRRQLTPDTTAVVRVHGHYYRALNQPNCSLISWPIARVVPTGIRTVDGIEHRVDCIIYAEDRP